MIIVTDGQNAYATGKTLTEAFENYRDEVDSDSIEDLSWYEATEIQVKLEVIKVSKTIVNKESK